MISNFALLLSHEGIKLAHRTADGWAELGHVSLLDDELSEKLTELRKQGEALAVKDFSTKIVLPNDQIKYLTLPSLPDEDREAAIKEALEKTTPYLIDELVYDWEDGEDGMNVAAVARDTLSEAENFIVQHGFNPINFVAAPDDALFSVEPFFGVCDHVEADLDVTDNIEAEVDKVILTVPEEAPMAEVIVEVPTTDATEDAVEAPADAEPEQEDEFPPAEDTSVPDVPPIAPLVADRDKDLGDVKFPMLKPTTETSILRGMEPSIKPAPRIGMGAEHDEDVLDRSFPSWAGNGDRDKTDGSDDKVDTSKLGWLKAERSAEAEETTQPPSWMKTDADEAISEPEPEFEEEQEAAAWVPAAEAAAIKQPLYDQVESEAERLEIFGNRGEQSDRGGLWNPLWIGAIVVVLLIVIGASYLGFRYLSSPSEPQIAAPEIVDPTEDEGVTEASPEPVIETPLAEIAEPEVEATTELAADPTTPAPVEDTAIAQGEALEALEAPAAPETAPTQPEAEVALDVDATAPQDPTPEAETVAPQEQILSEAPTAADMAPERPASETPAAEAPSEAEPALPTDLLDRAATDWTSLSIEAREARYAASGIWPMAPAASPAPVSETVGALFLATVDPVVFATDAYAITSEAEMLSDKALTVVPNPPAPGTRFDRDERGLVVATPEGSVTPDGITVFLGIPPQLPPLAPRPDPVAQQEVQRAALEGKIPQLRPELEVATEAEAEAAEDFEPTANRIPPLRPAEIAALANVPEEPLNPLALNQTPMPRLRPNNIGEIIYNTERATIAAQTTTAVAPSNATVGNRATEENALSLRGVNLIGIYGEAGDRRALVRLQSGRYTKIEVGDRLNGGQVTAIDKDRVLYVRNGQTIVLRMPSP